jgi:soluble lytic murein transglycosylase-like protein
LIRSIVINATLLIFVFPIIAWAQETARQVPGPSAAGREIKRTATLTTRDTLDPTDFAKPAVASKAEPPKKLDAAKKNEAEPTLKSVAQPQTEVMGTVARRPPVAAVTAGSIVLTGDAKLDELINTAATRYRLDPRLMIAVMRQESSFNPRAVSPKGARGLMQLMPATAARFGVRDLYDPAQNIEGGAQYLRFLLDTFNGDVELALAGYNAGENAVARYGNHIPPYRETMDYVQRISAHYNRLTNGSVMPPASSLQPVVSERRSEPGLIGGWRMLTQY